MNADAMDETLKFDHLRPNTNTKKNIINPSYKRKNPRTLSALTKKMNLYKRQYLFSNEEAMNKYLKRLRELYKSS